jgi:hypothetical protein
MPNYTFVRYIEINNNKYVVASGSYTRKWQRAFSSQLAGNIIRLNFIDRGPGIRVYDATLILRTWPPGSRPYLDGITQTWQTQLNNLETSYAQVATVLQFQDPLGQSPGASSNYGVFFTNFNEIIPNYSTPQQPYILAEVELTEATQLVN